MTHWEAKLLGAPEWSEIPGSDVIRTLPDGSSLDHSNIAIWFATEMLKLPTGDRDCPNVVIRVALRRQAGDEVRDVELGVATVWGVYDVRYVAPVPEGETEIDGYTVAVKLGNVEISNDGDPNGVRLNAARLLAFLRGSRPVP